jgi:nucleotide-binding universal stress UspA family protein
MFQRILVPVDLTEKSLMGVERAVELARENRAEITLLHVIETVEHISFDEMKQFYDRLEKSAREGLKECAERYADEGLKITEVVAYGHRSKEIVDFAVENRIDLIVVASHRIDPDRPGHDWSTISYAVAILAPCPVLLVK